ncbi:hypothetical protein CHS0354_010379 [Potamilus streckersoni]|uniref:Uncharacterized protein n=1 Tax=Potamilus streckersoni TaxID=2493646 RepID=A0AAE0TEK3_9BIVA|nr:hypothetical protein CHS0354_010379 [Potamilus streckersoni]
MEPSPVIIGISALVFLVPKMTLHVSLQNPKIRISEANATRASFRTMAIFIALTVREATVLAVGIVVLTNFMAATGLPRVWPGRYHPVGYNIVQEKPAVLIQCISRFSFPAEVPITDDFSQRSVQLFSLYYLKLMTVSDIRAISERLVADFEQVPIRVGQHKMPRLLGWSEYRELV